MRYDVGWTIAVLEDLRDFFDANNFPASCESMKKAITIVQGELSLEVSNVLQPRSFDRIDG